MTAATTQTERKPLSIGDVLALSEVVNAASQGARVAYLTEDETQPRLGIARSVQSSPGAMLHDTDIRDGLLWVTTRSGTEQWWPIADLLPAHREGRFLIYDWSEK